MREILTSKQFAVRAKAHDLPPEFAVAKSVAIEEKQVDESTRSVLYVISTASIDRDGDVISLDGWDLTSYRKNPVVLWGHQAGQPSIGLSPEVFIRDGKLYAWIEFLPPEISDFADRLYQRALYRSQRNRDVGALNATSVGFLPRKWAYAESEGRKFGIDFSEQELLEISLVNVPANAEALEARHVDETGPDVRISAIRQWCEIPG